MAKQLNEFPMTFNSPERPAPDVERAMANRETSFSRNPGIPNAGEEPGQSGEEFLASKRFQQVVEKVKRMTGMTDLRGRDQTLGMLVYSTFMEVSQFESQHKEELEQLAERLVREELGDVANEIRFELNLVGMGQTQNNFQTQEKEPENAQEMSEEELEGEQEAFELFDKFNDESAKRRIINAIIQGSAMKGHYLIQKPEAIDMVSQIAGAYGQELVNKYGIMMAITEYQYWTIPNMEDMVGGGAGVNGSEEVEYSEEEEKWVVKAQAVMFPILIHEALKGAMEVIGQHGVPDDPKMAKAVIEKEDILYKEVWDQRIGPMIWEKFRSSLPYDLLDDTDESKRLLLYVLMEFFALPVTEFLRANKRMLSGDNRDITSIIAKVKRDFYENPEEAPLDIPELERLIDNNFNELVNDDEFSIYDDPAFKDLLGGIGKRKPDNGQNLSEELNRIKRLLK